MWQNGYLSSPIEVLKQSGVRLVDRAENGLSRSGELLQESDNIKGTLTIQTRGRLIQEK